MNVEKPLVYLILGATGSGRREVLADLIADGLDETDRPVVMLASDEPAEVAAEARPATVVRWAWRDQMIAAEWPAEATHVFFVADGRRNPVDQIEVFKPWVEAHGGEFARVLCVVNCQLAEKHAALQPWFEACVHFSDVVLLNRREGVANKWMSDFVATFKDQYYPCVFEMVKAGRVKNPALVLEPQARRMSHVFDEEPNWVITGESGEKLDEDELEDEESEEEVEVAPEEDPYFERRNGGRRVKELPDIAKYLGSEGQETNLAKPD